MVELSRVMQKVTFAVHLRFPWCSLSWAMLCTVQAEQLQQAWRRASQSPDAPPQQGLDYGGGEGLHEGRAVSAFQRSPAWTNDTFGAFKPVRNWACTPQ